ncbi:uncharacterized protein LOC135714823 [Ochlerotatus camptorhynchus]|uniref:uncharacterized protein LOC135714823 n=1 Tax=Ochlerotatus camptorhynchus TaxID=644619 RepID=UPI0031DAEC1B
MTTSDYTSDILRPLSRQELSDLKDLYYKHCPLEIQFYFLIKNQLEWDEKLEKLNRKQSICARAYLKFYSPRFVNPKETGTFVAITCEEYPSVYFHSLREGPSQLLKYLTDTQRINWSCHPVLCSISDQHMEILDTLLKQVNCVGELLSDCSYYMITNNQAASFEYEVPSDVVIKELDPAYGSLMNERWPHRYPNSEMYIKLLIELNGGLGLFNKDSDDIIGWALKNEFAGVGHLQVMPKHRQKGYGELLAKAITKKIALEDGGTVNLFIVDKNVNSIHLFTKLGYKLIAGSNWIQARNIQ